ncbi:hypothetical protein WA026_018549 [Henosepilachna vigintioctopunctata]|uniref:C2H2-type domain-containing protein n=1 Tax=Henosepilachna vigintioctopunctata TaxID=420089 RepID=A0AAW1U9A2_9CUCU
MMSSIVYENVDGLELLKTSIIDVKQEILEIGHIKVEDISDQNTIHVVNEVKVENCEISPTEEFVTVCNSQFITTKKRDDFRTEDESKRNINQKIHGSGPKEDVFSSWNPDSVKIECCENFQSKAEGQGNLASNLNLVNFKWKECISDYGCSLKSDFEQHNSIQLTLSNNKCELCEFSALSMYSIQNHIKTVHLKEKNYKCELCDYSTLRTDLIQRHITVVHLKVKNHKCKFCEYSTHSEWYLKTHIKTIHLKISDHKCELCEYNATTNSNLQRHVRSVHLKLRKHKCHLCDHSTSTSSQLRSHIEEVHLKLRKHKCKLCEYSSNRKRYLKTHIKTVHLKISDYKCELCDYNATINSNLQKHVRSVHLKISK